MSDVQFIWPTLSVCVCVCLWKNGICFIWFHCRHANVLCRSLAVLDPRVGHTMDILSQFISVLRHSDWLFHGDSCPRLDVVHPGRAWSSSPACTWHWSLHYLFLQATRMCWNVMKQCSVATCMTCGGIFASFLLLQIRRRICQWNIVENRLTCDYGH